MPATAEPETQASHRPADHPPVASGNIGVLLVNLGTPDATDADFVRRYLREFLSDKRVIEENTLVWKFVLNCIVLPFRPQEEGPRLREDLEPGQERVAAQDHHALAGRQARQCRWNRSGRAREGRLGDALRQSRRSPPASTHWRRRAASAS